MGKQKDAVHFINMVRRVREGLHISESEFARSFVEAKGELSAKAIELECTGVPPAAIALALLSIAEKWSASGLHADAIREFVLVIAQRFPSGSPKLADIQTEYEKALNDRDAPWRK
jgi:hypothetical protein